ncbi:MAG TPA: TetR/AcrR family transcriptional regulator [Candidatus Nanopelagicales bacterium]|jgi:AcrR family transcriptional regulator
MSTATGTRAQPLTERGRRTRENLLAAGRRVFEERGYANTRISDIAKAAGVSHGTVYTWFDDKESLLRALVDDIVTEVFAALAIGDDVPEPEQRMLEANRRYLAAYRRHGRMLEVVEEAAATDARYRDALAGVRRDHVGRVTRDIARLQRDGIAERDVDPAVAAGALCAMVEGFGRHWYGRGEQAVSTHDDETAVETLTRLWARGLGIRTAREEQR